jgi:hypothetical protein
VVLLLHSPVLLVSSITLGHKGGKHLPLAAVALGRHVALAKAGKDPATLAFEPPDANAWSAISKGIAVAIGTMGVIITIA